MDKVKKILKKLKGVFSKLNELREGLIGEVLLYWRNEKNNTISLFVCLSFITFILGMLLFAFVYTRAFFAILFIILSIGIIFAVEVSLGENNPTQYPLLRKIKHILIRSIAYPIVFLLIKFILYVLLFN